MKKSFIFNLLFTALAIMSISFISCTKDEDVDQGAPYLTISTNSIQFEADGSVSASFDEIVEIETNREWSVTMSPSTASEWLTVAPMKGEGDGEISFSMPAAERNRQATVTVATYNSYGILLEEKIAISQLGTGGGVNSQTIIMDGSQLPTSYTDNAEVEIDGVTFSANLVANFTATYPDSNGPIQFMKGSSSFYNTLPLDDLSYVSITLAPAGTSYNNFVVYAGTAENPESETVLGVKNGDVVTYAVPEGSTYFSIVNPSDYTAYASEIKMVCGEESGEVTPSNDVTFDGSEFVAEYCDNAIMNVDGIEFIVNQVANMTSLYPSAAGDIQFKKEVSFIYNNEAINGLSSVEITLAGDNNFTVYAGTASNPAGDAIIPSVADGVAKYAIPTGSSFVAVKNVSEYATYADQIKFVTGGTTVTPPTGGGNEGDPTGENVVFDGSELPTAYGDNVNVSIEGVNFIVNKVANFMEQYPDSQGAIQFMKSESYIYNTTAMEDLTSVAITLAPAGTSYNNFEVYAGTSENPSGTAIEPTKNGDVCTYAIAEGSTYVLIKNTSNYTAYASRIEMVVDGDTTVTPPTGGDDNNPTDSEVIYFETMGDKSVSSPFPFVEEYTSWNTSGSGSSSVTYSGESVSIRSSGKASGGYDDASGPNNLFFGTLPANVVINSIALTSEQTDLTLSFGSCRSKYADSGYDNVFYSEKLVVSLSSDGTTWTPITYTNTDSYNVDPYWVYATADFTLAKPVSTLYIKFEALEASVYRIDDVKLSVGKGGDSVDLGEGSVTPPTGGGNEGGNEGGDDNQGGSTGEAVVTFDGSELPTAYSENSVISVDGVDFTINLVANFLSTYPDSQGPIQFKKADAFLYNNTAIEGLTAVTITLAPAGTTYNNFEVYAGTTANPTGTAIEVAKSGDVCTYAIPADATFVAIKNPSNYTAYASEIKFVK